MMSDEQIFYYADGQPICLGDYVSYMGIEMRVTEIFHAGEKRSSDYGVPNGGVMFTPEKGLPYALSYDDYDIADPGVMFLQKRAES